jgi:hypothetical protein
MASYAICLGSARASRAGEGTHELFRSQRFKSHAISANWATPKAFASEERVGISISACQFFRVWVYAWGLRFTCSCLRYVLGSLHPSV